MLWGVAVWFVAAGVVALASPIVLTVGRWQMLHPRLALTAWFGAFFLGIVLTLLGFAACIFATLRAHEGTPMAESVLLTTTGWCSLGILGGVIGFVCSNAEPLAGLHRAGAAPVLSRSSERRRGFTLVRFESAAPVSYAVPGAHPQIHVSSELERVLTPEQVRAVVAHEYAHLRQHHGAAIRIAQVNALCLTRLRPGRALLRATLLLVELAADDAAACRARAVHLANALSTLGHLTGDERMLLRADRLTHKRWRRASRRLLPAAVRTAVPA